jgi:hypothetical protein
LAYQLNRLSVSFTVCDVGFPAHGVKARCMVLILKAVINVPTIVINALVGSLLQRYAARGAARTPPAIKPTIICHCTNPLVVMRVAYDENMIITEEQLRIDLDEIRRSLENAHADTFCLSLSVAYPTMENMGMLVQVAYQEA